MSDLQDIPKVNPVVVPAKSEKVYDKQYCVSLFIDTQPNKPWNARISGLPYDGEDVLKDSPASLVRLNDLKALAVHDVELAQAMGAVLAIVGKYLVKCEMANKWVVTTENIQEILE